MKHPQSQSPLDDSHPQTLRWRAILLTLLIGVLILAGFLFNWQLPTLPSALAEENATSTPLGSIQTENAPTFTPTFPPTTTNTATPQPTNTPTALPSPGMEQGSETTPSNNSPANALVLSLYESGFRHLFIYNPSGIALTPVTSGDWDDVSPAVSPDGSRIAFSSNRSGFWDIYILDLVTGALTRVTDTPEYDGAPSLSPDGQWVVYESYTIANTSQTPNLDLFIQPIQPQTNQGNDRIQLTNNPAADFSPAWSPGGRQIAFVSNRSGDNEIWLADLDLVDERFRNFSHNAQTEEKYPAWSGDGKVLAWTTQIESLPVVVASETTQTRASATTLGSGEQSTWDAENGAFFTITRTPNHVYLSGYTLGSHGVVLPLIPLPSEVAGFDGGVSVPMKQITSWASSTLLNTSTPEWKPALTVIAGIPGQRQHLVTLDDVKAPQPLLQDLVDESFTALRKATANRTGWDLLGTLDNAFVPLTAPLTPGFQQDWLYTGRAFAFNTAALNAGWMVVVREDYGAKTYWRIYLRTRYQDGSQGEPLHAIPWNFDARSSGDPNAYESGGAPTDTIPAGYWIDFTQLAASYGWERLPALLTWRSSYTASRFNEFANKGGLDWGSAMQAIYPPEVLQTATPQATPVSNAAQGFEPAPDSTVQTSPAAVPTNSQSNNPTSTP